MNTKFTLAIVLGTLFSPVVISQTTIDSTQIKREYSNLEEALQNPEKVYRLNLSNQNIELPKESWSKFINLQYLSFENDHLKEMPKEIGLLKNLKVLDLSGNDFKILPKTISELVNLEELFLNNEKI
jgi:Leucine-rich repeat (LRR) protein